MPTDPLYATPTAWRLIVAERADYRPWMDDAGITYDPDTGAARATWCYCWTCGRGWNDAAITSRTPAPSGRCPFEDEHQDEPEPADRTEVADLELAARLAQRADADDYTDAARLWQIAARAADLAARPDALIVEHLDALAQRALALAVDAEHRSRKS